MNIYPSTTEPTVSPFSELIAPTTQKQPEKLREGEMPEHRRFMLDGGDLWSTAMKMESLWTLPIQGPDVDEDLYTVDPSFTDEQKKKYIQDKNINIHEKFMDTYIGNVRNRKHADEMAKYYEKESAKLRYFETQPWWKQMGMATVAEATNVPLYIGATALAPATVGVAGTSALGGLIMGTTTSLVIDGIKDNFGEIDKTAFEYAVGAVINGGISSAMGGFTKHATEKIADKHIKQTSGVNKEVEKDVDNATSMQEKRDIIKTAMDEKKIAPQKDALEAIDEHIAYSKDNVLTRMWEAARQDMEYIMKKSPSKTMSDFAHKTFADATLQRLKLDEIDYGTAQKHIENVLRGERQGFTIPLINRFSDIIGAGAYSRKIKASTQVEDLFSTLLGGIQLRRSLYQHSVDDSIDEVVQIFLQSQQKTLRENEINDLKVLLKEASEKMEEYNLKLHKKMAEEGHIDFVVDPNTGKPRIPENPTYFPKVYSPDKISNLQLRGLEKKDFIDFFKHSLKGYEDVPEHIKDEVASTFYEKIILSKGKARATQKSLFYDMQNDPSLSDEAQGVFSRRLSELDYSAKKTYTTKDGEEIELSFQDILEDSYTGVMDNYIRRMSGSTVLQKHKWKPTAKPIRPAKIEGEEDISELTAMLNKAVTGKKIKEAKQIRARIKELYPEEGDEIIALANDIRAAYREIAREAHQVATERVGKRTKENAEEYDKVFSKVYDSKKGSVKQNIAEQKKRLREIENQKRVKHQARILARQESDEIKFMDEQIEVAQQKVIEAEESLAAAEDIIKIISREVNEILKNESPELIASVQQQIEKALLEGDISKVRTIIKDTIGTDIELPEGLLNEISKRVENIIEARDIDLDSMIKARDIKLDEIAEEIITESADPSARTLYSHKDFDDLREQIREELNDMVGSGELTKTQADKELVRFDNTMRYLMGQPTSKNSQSTAQQVNRIVQAWNMARMLGETGITMMTEGIAVAWDQGFKNLITKVPYIKDLLKAYRTGKFDRKELEELQEFLGIFDEYISGAKVYEFNHEYSAITPKRTKLDKAENISNYGSEFTLMTGGVKLGSAFYKAVQAVGTMQRLYKVAKTGKKNATYKKMIRELALSPASEQKLLDEILKHASSNKVMNFGKWDPEIRRLFLAGLNRRSDSIVQVQNIGDQMAWVVGDEMVKDTVAGKMAMSLKTFALTSYTKQLGRMLVRGDAHMAGLLALYVFTSTIAEIGRATWNYQDNPEKLRKALEPETLGRNALFKMPISGVSEELLGAAELLLVGTQVTNPSRKQNITDEAIGNIPAADLINEIFKLSDIFTGGADGEHNIDDLRSAAKLMGISNHWITKPVWESAVAKPQTYVK